MALALGLLALPVGLLLAVAIVLDTRGPVFYTQVRMGKGWRRFRLFKFRSMVENADEVLKRHLKEHPDQAIEWESKHKLKNDPRITRVGRLLRKTSLDELPQLWNVLRGDMSIVGPRPIVAEEIAKYGPAFSVYSKVQPGLTGLWQVSGRTDLSYRRRTELDTEYVRKWSPWLDAKILLKTVRVVLLGHGAY